MRRRGYGGLAAAGRADEGDKLTFRYVECNVGYGEESFSAGLEFLANAGKTNERGGHGMYLIRAARPAAP